MLDLKAQKSRRWGRGQGSLHKTSQRVPLNEGSNGLHMLVQIILE